jgi:hypothetical protein
MTRCYHRNKQGDRCNEEYRHEDDALAHYYPRSALRFLDTLRPLTDEEAYAYLTDEGGSVLCSRYGRTGDDCAAVALAVAIILEGETGEGRSVDSLEYVMGLVVNDHDDPEYLLREYGVEYGYNPTDFLD